MLARTLVSLHLHDRGSVCFPARLKPGEGLLSHSGPNLDPKVFQALDRAGLAGQEPDGGETVSRLFRIVLALTHAPQYQADHADALSQDWAHVPIPSDHILFDALVSAGAAVATLLDPGSNPDVAIAAVLGAAAVPTLGTRRHSSRASLRSADLDVTISYFGAAKGEWTPRNPVDGEVLSALLGSQTGDLYLNGEVFLAHVPEKVWTYELGGYPVLRKWLGYRHRDRLGRPLALAEARHLRSMVQRIAALLAFGPELDPLYEQATSCALTAEQLGLRVV